VRRNPLTASVDSWGVEEGADRAACPTPHRLTSRSNASQDSDFRPRDQERIPTSESKGQLQATQSGIWIPAGRGILSSTNPEIIDSSKGGVLRSDGTPISGKQRRAPLLARKPAMASIRWTPTLRLRPVLSTSTPSRMSGAIGEFDGFKQYRDGQQGVDARSCSPELQSCKAPLLGE
jgi:hypothetical protein